MTRDSAGRFARRMETSIGDKRICTRCGVEQPLSDFEKRSNRPSGRGSRCRECMRKRTKVYYSEHVNERRAHARRYGRLVPKDRKRYRTLTSREVMERYPEKERARRTLRNAVQKGHIAKPGSCTVCGCVPRRHLHGHHDDYSRPLDVSWLCHDCHMLRHRKPLLPPEEP